MKFCNEIRTYIAMAAAILALPNTLAIAQPTPVHEYRFGGDGADSAGIADGTPGSFVAFTSAGVPAGLGRAMVVGTIGSHPLDVINVPNADFIDFGIGDFAIAFWVRRDNSDSDNVDGICDALSGTGRGWEVYFTSTDTLKVRLDDDNGNTAQYDSTTIFADTQWHHVLISVDRDAAAGLVIYIDGAFDSAHDPTPISGNIDPNQNLWIGGRNDSNSQGLDGELAILQIFNSALTAIEAAQLSAIGFPIHQYDFEADGLDSVGTADGAVGVNVSFNSVDVPVELGQAAVFGSDGGNADNRIDVPQASFTDFGLDDFSISIWVKRDVNSGTTQGILDNLGNDGTQLQFLGNDILRARIDDDLGNESRPESLTAITDLGWHHLLMTIDRDAIDGAKWYIDGQLDNSDDLTVLTGSILADQDLRIGTINGFGLRGQLAKLTFYDAALSANDAFDLADLDRDGVPYVFDACPDFDDNIDADSDGVPDGCDACNGFDDNLDADADGVPDACDICPGLDDTLDADADGVPDGCDACNGFDDNLDADADTVADGCDNCPNDANLDQMDSDSDNHGDVCDMCPGIDDNIDADTDGVPDACDVCPGFDDNRDQDSDGIPDSCDVTPPGIICVWASAPGNQDGTNWFNAYHDLAFVVAAAGPGDEIWVATGTYFPDGGFQPVGGAFTAGAGGRGNAFQLQSGVAIYGGFAGYELVRDDRNPGVNVTILSGDINGNGSPGGNSFHVVESDAADDATAVIDGFTVTGGNADGTSPRDIGGGLYNNGGSPTIIQCTFLENSAVTGGGLFNNGGSPMVSYCAFLGNAADATATIPAARGGGLYNTGGSPTVSHCIFSGNYAIQDHFNSGSLGGGMYTTGGAPTIIHCAFTENYLSTDFGNQELGHGLYINNNAPIISNSVFHNNAGAGESNQIHVNSGTPVVNYSDVRGGWSGAGVGNINADPLFTDADGPDDIPGTEDDDLSLRAGSPCIDAGDNGAIPAGVVTDLAGNIGRVDDPATPDTGIGLCAIVDMGPYEFQAGGEADSDGDSVCDSTDICPGFDDTIDTDADGTPDGCDACPTTLLGDVNGDTFVDAADITEFAGVLLNPTDATPDELCAADVDNDGVVDGLDVQPLVELMLAP